MKVLFFCPSAEKPNAEQVLRILLESVIKTEQPNVDVVSENDISLNLGSKNYDAVVVIYTPEVELSETLFEIVHYININIPPGRFFFLPIIGETRTIPPIFHSIRHQQQHLFYYPETGHSPHPLKAQFAPFKTAWHEFIAPSLINQPEYEKKGPKSVPFWLILISSIIIIILSGLISVVFPPAQKYLLSLTPTQLCPPTATNFWLQESFQNIDTITRWQVQHFYSGKQAIQITPLGNALRLSSEPVVTDAVYQLDSLQKWSLDELQSLSFSFTLSAMEDQAAINALVFGLYLSEDSSYRLDCLIVPAETDGEIQCQVQSSKQVEALSEAIPLTLDVEHVATLVFNPRSYIVQFFLDNTFYGQREIQSVEYWRTRDFNLQIKSQVENLSTGSFSCELDSLNLSHQP